MCQLLTRLHRGEFELVTLSYLQLQVGAGELVAAIFLIIIVLIILGSTIKIVKEYERIVVLRMGRLLGEKGPGMVIVLPFIDRVRYVDLRLHTLDVPKQRIITRDNITVDVDAVLYFRVDKAVNAVIKIQDFVLASSMLGQTTLRDVIGQVEFDELLMKREELNKRLQVILDEATEPWGIKVTAVAVRDAAIPDDMQRAIAKQAEAEREKRSRIIVAEGELLAAKMMEEAANHYVKNPSALRLRELQTYAEIAREKNLMVVTEQSGMQQLGPLLGIVGDLRRKRQ